MSSDPAGDATKCPFLAYKAMQDEVSKSPQKNLDLSILSQPAHMDNSDYANRVKNIDVEQLKADIVALLKESKDWWPADYGHYGPFMCRLAWHAAGTYRIYDGRGGGNTGNQRFQPLYAWPDNGNLDKARRLLWPIKKKYGQNISWGDLMLLAGNAGMEDMGFKSFGFGFGRVDCWAQEKDTFWGVAESYQGLAKEPWNLEKPLAAPNMELIYVNPEGPDAIPDPLMAALHIRDSFARMAMNDEETVALIAGGHTFGKAHGAGPGSNVGPDPRGAKVEDMGFGWINEFGTGKGKDTITSGLEGAWTANPIEWDNGYFHNLYTYEWELYKSPAGAQQWRPQNWEEVQVVPDAHEPDKMSHPVMFTTDLALIKDPTYAEISKRYYENPDELLDKFGRAWYKLLHRDMGPVERLVGPEVAAAQIWQDPVPAGKPVEDVQALKTAIKSSGLSVGELVRAAWSSASTFRKTDYRGGANGARVRLAPQKDWEVNNPAELQNTIKKLTDIANTAGASVADTIVLGGNCGVEMAAAAADLTVEVPFMGGRGDATDEQTDAASFDVLKPDQDAFRNMLNANPYKMVDKAHMLGLTVQEMTVLIGGLRVLGNNCEEAGSNGVLTSRPGVLTPDFFVTITDMSYRWESAGDNVYRGYDRATGAQVPTASLCDLTFGSNPELRNICEEYACDDGAAVFVKDFCNAWAKVMANDSYGRLTQQIS